MSLGFGGDSRNQFITPSTSPCFRTSSIFPRGIGVPETRQSASNVEGSTCFGSTLLFRIQLTASIPLFCFCLGGIDPCINESPARVRRALTVVSSRLLTFGSFFRSQAIASSANFFLSAGLISPTNFIPGILARAASVGSSKSSRSGSFIRSQFSASSTAACLPS